MRSRGKIKEKVGSFYFTLVFRIIIILCLWLVG